MPEIVSCAVCGDELERYPSQLEDSSYFVCSKSCESQYKRKRVEVECDNCGDSIEKIPSQNELSNLSFCDRECKFGYFTDNNHPNWVNEKNKEVYTCNFCESEFERYPKPDEYDYKYCSEECYHSDRTGKNHPNWKGGWFNTGYRNYGSEWESWRQKIIERDEVCQRCGDNPDRNCVHHIRPARKFAEDGDVSEAHYDENLCLLCEECHGIVEHNWSIEEQIEDLICKKN